MQNEVLVDALFESSDEGGSSAGAAPESLPVDGHVFGETEAAMSASHAPPAHSVFAAPSGALRTPSRTGSAASSWGSGMREGGDGVPAPAAAPQYPPPPSRTPSQRSLDSGTRGDEPAVAGAPGLRTHSACSSTLRHDVPPNAPSSEGEGGAPLGAAHSASAPPDSPDEDEGEEEYPADETHDPDAAPPRDDGGAAFSPADTKPPPSAPAPLEARAPPPAPHAFSRLVAERSASASTSSVHSPDELGVNFYVGGSPRAAVADAAAARGGLTPQYLFAHEAKGGRPGVYPPRQRVPSTRAAGAARDILGGVLTPDTGLLISRAPADDLLRHAPPEPDAELDEDEGEGADVGGLSSPRRSPPRAYRSGMSPRAVAGCTQVMVSQYRVKDAEMNAAAAAVAARRAERPLSAAARMAAIRGTPAGDEEALRALSDMGLVTKSVDRLEADHRRRAAAAARGRSGSDPRDADSARTRSRSVGRGVQEVVVPPAPAPSCRRRKNLAALRSRNDRAREEGHGLEGNTATILARYETASCAKNRRGSPPRAPAPPAPPSPRSESADASHASPPPAGPPSKRRLVKKVARKASPPPPPLAPPPPPPPQVAPRTPRSLQHAERVTAGAAPDTSPQLAAEPPPRAPLTHTSYTQPVDGAGVDGITLPAHLGAAPTQRREVAERGVVTEPEAEPEADAGGRVFDYEQILTDLVERQRLNQEWMERDQQVTQETRSMLLQLQQEFTSLAQGVTEATVAAASPPPPASGGGGPVPDAVAQKLLELQAVCSRTSLDALQAKDDADCALHATRVIYDRAAPLRQPSDFARYVTPLTPQSVQKLVTAGAPALEPPGGGVFATPPRDRPMSAGAHRVRAVDPTPCQLFSAMRPGAAAPPRPQPATPRAAAAATAPQLTLAHQAWQQNAASSVSNKWRQRAIDAVSHQF